MSIWGSRARGAILAKTNTALTREHDFQGFEGPKKEPQMAPKTASNATWLQERLRSLWSSILYNFGARLGVQNRWKTVPKIETYFTWFQGAPEIVASGSDVVIVPRFGPGGNLLGGG